MSDVDKVGRTMGPTQNNLDLRIESATQTQINNIQARTGKTLEELNAIIQGSGLTKHGEIRAMLQQELSLGYGDGADHDLAKRLR